MQNIIWNRIVVGYLTVSFDNQNLKIFDKLINKNEDYITKKLI